MHTLPDNHDNSEKDVEFFVDRLRQAEKLLLAFDAEHPNIADPAPVVAPIGHKHVVGKEKKHDDVLRAEYSRLQKQVVEAGENVDWAREERSWYAGAITDADAALENAELREYGKKAPLSQREEILAKKALEGWALENL